MNQGSALEALLLERIATQGPMPFAAYMQLALYHPRFGYYAHERPRTGWGGHFVTSPEIDPAFGQLWAAGFELIWDACGSPRHFEVVEIGPGEGGFAEAVLSVAAGDFAAALTYRLVERSPEAEERQRARLAAFPQVSWTGSLVELPAVRAGVVFANEVIDNLPVHLVEKRDGELREVCVGASQGRLAWTPLPPSSPQLERFLERTGVDLPEGHRIEVPLASESFVARAAGRLQRGALVLIDYGAEATSLAERRGGSLLCYSATGVDDDPLERPGKKDITSHANWSAVRRAGIQAGLTMIGPLPQRDILMSLGAARLDASLRQEHQGALSDGAGGAAVSALSRRHALRALLDEGGLGGLGVMVGLAGIEEPDFLKAKDPSHRDGSSLLG